MKNNQWFLYDFKKEGERMEDFEKMYYRLSGDIADVIEKLQDVQREMEEVYLSDVEPDSREKEQSAL